MYNNEEVSMEHLDCIFCRIVQQKVPTTILAETELFLAILNIDSYAEGHTLILPKRHVVTPVDFSPTEWQNFGEILGEVTHVLKKKYGATAVRHWSNDGSGAGQTVWHAHHQVLPFYRGEIPEDLIRDFKDNMRRSATA
jgi:histidine triad (HIT) family protein